MTLQEDRASTLFRNRLHEVEEALAGVTQRRSIHPEDQWLARSYKDEIAEIEDYLKPYSAAYHGMLGYVVPLSKA